MQKRGKTKQLQEEQKAIGEIYKQYIDIFEGNSHFQTQTFIKSNVLFADKSKETKKSPEIYNPKPIIKRKSNQSSTKSIQSDNCVSKAKYCKSNLKSLGDKLKQLQQERQIFKNHEITTTAQLDYTNEDDNSTNLFVSNLNPQVTENDLINLFGKFGPLASVKIMWPRNESEKRKTNFGFVAFMSRKDAGRALLRLNYQNDMIIEWGKPIEIPLQPIFIPEELYKLYSSFSPTGLPFNAQPIKSDYKIPKTDKEMTDLLYDSVVKVTIPFNKKQLMLIHRMIEFVISEGPSFEAIIMNYEINNSDYDFLTNYKSPEHIYYRWKLYSMLNGDSKYNWSKEPFRMYQNGSIWIPPTIPDYKAGMPEKLINQNNYLSETQTNRFISIIKNLNLSRISIGKGMIFCMEHLEAIDDCFDLILDSFQYESTEATKKVARFYLISDIIHNCKKKQIYLKKFNETTLNRDIFNNLSLTYSNLKYQNDKENFKTRILNVLRFWLNENYFNLQFINNAENIIFDYADNNSLTDEPLDGANLIKRSFINKSEDFKIITKNKLLPTLSNWNRVNPKILESQAMSTKKMYELNLIKY